VEVATVAVHHTLEEAIVVAWEEEVLVLVIVVALVVEVWEEVIVVEAWEEVIVDDKNPIRYYFWLVYYYIKNLPQIIYLYLYREYLYLKLIIIELFDL
jgi:hypothetical protein